jgi:hypothetical protein
LSNPRRSVFAVLDQHIQPGALLFAEPNDEFASGLLFRGHDVSPVGPETPTQTLAAKSMTRGTSVGSRRSVNHRGFRVNRPLQTKCDVSRFSDARY